MNILTGNSGIKEASSVFAEDESSLTCGGVGGGGGGKEAKCERDKLYMDFCQLLLWI